MAEFLDALTDDERAAFRALGRVRRFAKGEAIFHEGDDAGGVVAVVSGTVKVSLIGVGGREVVLRFSGSGELVGELAAVGDRPRTANVTAVGPVEAILVRAADFRRLALEHPRIANLVFDNVATLLAEADRLSGDELTRRVDQIDAVVREYIGAVREATNATIVLHGASGLSLTKLREFVPVLAPLSRAPTGGGAPRQPAARARRQYRERHLPR